MFLLQILQLVKEKIDQLSNRKFKKYVTSRCGLLKLITN